MSDVAVSRSGWFSIITSAATAVVVGFASTILLIVQAAQSVGATPSQQASWAAVLCFGMALTTLYLSWTHRMPIITAWSTPGAALIATSASGISYENALGAFVVAGLLMCLAALVKPLARAIAQIPAPIAAAMLAGVLLKYALGVPAAALSMPLFVLPLVVVFFGLRLSFPLFAAPVVVVLGVAMAAFAGSFTADCCAIGFTRLEWTTPQFDGATILSLGVPLFLVTMASQNLPGFAVLRAGGYEPPVTSCLLTTGLASMAMAPFGSHAVNMAAITASLVTGPDTHEDPGEALARGLALSRFVCGGWACRCLACADSRCIAWGPDHNDCGPCAFLTADGQRRRHAERSARHRERADHVSGDRIRCDVLWRGFRVLGTGGGAGAVRGAAFVSIEKMKHYIC